MERAFPFPCLLIIFCMYLCPGSFPLRKSCAASENAHLKWALPIFFPEVSIFLPFDSLAHLTSRQYETRSCTRGNRCMFSIS